MTDDEQPSQPRPSDIGTVPDALLEEWGLEEGAATLPSPNGTRQPDTAPAVAAPRRAPLADQLEASLAWGTRFDVMPPLAPLVDGILDRGTLAVIYGPSGSGKSLLAQDLSQAVSSGRDWRGHKVHRGRVLYIAAEGGRGIPGRHVAWRMHHRVEAELDIAWLLRRVNLLDADEVAALAQMVRTLRPVFIVCDTLARSMAGGDENKSVDMSAVVEAADTVRREGDDCCFAFVHHSGIQTGRLRGSTALRGAIETEIQVAPAGLNGFTVTTEKQRDHATEGLWHFELRTVGNSVVAVASNAPQKPNKPDLVALRVLKEMDPAGAPSDAWEARSGMSRTAFFRSRKNLLSLGLVEQLSPTTFRATDSA